MIGSHFEPELAHLRPARSVTVIWMSLAATRRSSWVKPRHVSRRRVGRDVPTRAMASLTRRTGCPVTGAARAAAAGWTGGGCLRVRGIPARPRGRRRARGAGAGVGSRRCRPTWGTRAWAPCEKLTSDTYSRKIVSPSRHLTEALPAVVARAPPVVEPEAVRRELERLRAVEVRLGDPRAQRRPPDVSREEHEHEGEQQEPLAKRRHQRARRRRCRAAGGRTAGLRAGAGR